MEMATEPSHEVVYKAVSYRIGVAEPAANKLTEDELRGVFVPKHWFINSGRFSSRISPSTFECGAIPNLGFVLVQNLGRILKLPTWSHPR